MHKTSSLSTDGMPCSSAIRNGATKKDRVCVAHTSTIATKPSGDSQEIELFRDTLSLCSQRTSIVYPRWVYVLGMVTALQVERR